jgi:brefeldin A-resistance guanine nucleotide exchange factor 1
VHESIKNVILVMHTAGLLVAPLEDEHSDSGNEGRLWRVTRDRVEQFMPGFMESFVPLSSAALPPSAEVSTTASPTAEKLDPSPADFVEPQTGTEPVGGTSIV